MPCASVAQTRASPVAAYYANLFKSATVSGTGSTYVFEGDGNRTSSTAGGTTMNFLYDSDRLPMLLTDGTRKYVYGVGLAYETDMTGNVQAVAHADALGSVRALTDGSGNLIETYRTDAFGAPTATQGSSTQPFGYTGEQADMTGLVYLRARMYDLQTGRFLQRDTVAKSGPGVSGWNRYTYAANNPTTITDPSGHCLGPLARWFPVCVAAIRGAIAIGNAVVSGLKGEPPPTSSAATSGFEGSAAAAAERELIGIPGAARLSSAEQATAARLQLLPSHLK